MAKQTIDLGIQNDPTTGDSLRDGAQKINENFDELYLGPKRLDWDYTVDDTEYVITMNGHRFFHNFTPEIGTGEEWFRNLFIGDYAGNFNLVPGGSGGARYAISCVGVGAYTLSELTTGNENVAIGTETLALLTTGSNNTGVGSAVLYSNEAGSNNTAVGRQCGVWLASGSDNTFVGKSAGHVATTQAQLTIYNAGVLLGKDSKGTQGASNEIVIGANAGGEGSNTCRIGDNNMIGYRVNVGYTPSVDNDLTTKKYSDDKYTPSEVSNEPTGATKVSNIVTISQADYDAGTPVATTTYLIVG